MSAQGVDAPGWIFGGGLLALAALVGGAAVAGGRQVRGAKMNAISNVSALALAKLAAKQLHAKDPDFFEGGCADISKVICTLLRRRGHSAMVRYGHGRHQGKRFPHAWLEVAGRPFDPVLWAQGLAGRLEPASTELVERSVAELIGPLLDCEGVDWRVAELERDLGC